MPRLQVQPRGLFPDISFGREPSHSTGGTFTHVAAGFLGAHLNPAVEKRKWRRSPRCQGRQAGILEFGLDKFLKNPQQDEFPALWVGQLLRSSDQTL